MSNCMGCAVCWLDQKDITWKYTGCVIRWLDWKNVVTWKGTWNVSSNHMGCSVRWPDQKNVVTWWWTWNVTSNLVGHACPPVWPKGCCMKVNLKCYIKPYVMRHPPASPKGCCFVTEPEMLHKTIWDMPSVGFTTGMLLGERSGRVFLKFYIKPWGTSIEIQLSELI